MCISQRQHRPKRRLTLFTIWWTKSIFSWAYYLNVIQWARDRGTHFTPCTGGWWAQPSLWSAPSLCPEESQESHYQYCQKSPHDDLEYSKKRLIFTTPWTHRLLIVHTNVLHKNKVQCSLTRQGTSEVHSQTRFVLSLQLITCKEVEWYRYRLASCQGVV